MLLATDDTSVQLSKIDGSDDLWRTTIFMPSDLPIDFQFFVDGSPENTNGLGCVDVEYGGQRRVDVVSSTPNQVVGPYCFQGCKQFCSKATQNDFERLTSEVSEWEWVSEWVVSGPRRCLLALS